MQDVNYNSRRLNKKNLIFYCFTLQNSLKFFKIYRREIKKIIRFKYK